VKKDKIIPIKHGSKYCYDEAYANLDTGEIEETPWDDGPSNALMETIIKIIKPSQAYRDNYLRIFGHD
jgi:hypothetical protein